MLRIEVAILEGSGKLELTGSLGIALRLSGLSSLDKRLIRLSGVEKLKNISII